jgi:hypothetical protein
LVLALLVALATLFAGEYQHPVIKGSVSSMWLLFRVTLTSSSNSSVAVRGVRLVVSRGGRGPRGGEHKHAFCCSPSGTTW